MTIKRIVDTKFWRDEKVIDTYSVEDKYFLLYLMTNPNTTQVGIYKAPKKVMGFETGYTRDVIEVLIDRFSNKYNNIAYNHTTQEIAILNSLKYSIVKGGKPVEDLLIKELNRVESDELIFLVYNHMTAWWLKSKRAFDKTVMKLFEQELQKRKVAKEKINDNENDNENEESYHDSYHDSLEHSTFVKSKGTHIDDIAMELFSDYCKDKSNNDLVLDMLVEFYYMRKEIKKPMTERAIKMFLTQLSQLSSDENEQIEMLRQSVINSWQSVYPLKNKETKQKSYEVETPDYMQKKGGLKGYVKVD